MRADGKRLRAILAGKDSHTASCGVREARPDISAGEGLGQLARICLWSPRHLPRVARLMRCASPTTYTIHFHVFAKSFQKSSPSGGRHPRSVCRMPLAVHAAKSPKGSSTKSWILLIRSPRLLKLRSTHMYRVSYAAGVLLPPRVTT